jgi:hypothetical protein
MSNEKSLVEEGIAKIFIWRHVYTIGDVIEFTQRFTPEIANLDTNVVRVCGKFAWVGRSPRGPNCPISSCACMHW